eukprot:sb/3461244/
MVNAGGRLYFGLNFFNSGTCGTGGKKIRPTCSYFFTLTLQPSNKIIQLDPFGAPHGTLRFIQSESEDDFVLGPRLSNPFPVSPSNDTSDTIISVNIRVRNLNFTHRKLRCLCKLWSLMMVGEIDDVIIYSDGALFTGSAEWRCDQGFTGQHCDQCIEGFAGPACNCTLTGVNDVCDPLTGIKSCKQGFYGEGCEVFCATEDETRYSCTKFGNKLCKYPFIGTNCFTVSPCEENLYGQDCTVSCTPIPGQKLCDTNGGAVCEGHYGGPDCGDCEEGYYGADCTNFCKPQPIDPQYGCGPDGEKVCVGNWTGEECGRCIPNHFPPSCNTWCIETEAYTCDGPDRICNPGWYPKLECDVACNSTKAWNCNTETGKKICLENRAGKNCEGCVPPYTKDSKTGECKKCTVPGRTWSCQNGTKWLTLLDGSLSCKAGFYNPPDCMVFCDATSEFYTCSSTGVKQCIGNRDVVTDCKICLPNYYGEDCDKYCYEPGLRFVCNTTTGNRECRKGFIGPECDACATDYYGTWCPKNEPCVLMCNQKCVNTVNYTCNIQGVLEMNADFSRTLYNKAEMFIPELIIAATTFTGALIIMGIFTLSTNTAVLLIVVKTQRAICRQNLAITVHLKSLSSCFFNKERKAFDATETFNTSDMVVGESDDVIIYSDGAVFTGSAEWRCDQGFTGQQCDHCIEGFAGPACNCTLTGVNDVCDPLTGIKSCKQGFYGEGCEVFCATDNETRYSCTKFGNRLCKYPFIGTNCSTVSPCLENLYGQDCTVSCTPIPGQKLCDTNGEAVCEGHYGGTNCADCEEVYYGADCTHFCKPQPNDPQYRCGPAGEKVCVGNWTGEDCDRCIPNHFPPSCNTWCIETEAYTCDGPDRICNPGWYPKLECDVACNSTKAWDCNKETGKKICLENRAGKNCEGCVPPYTKDSKTGECKKCTVPGRTWSCQNGTKVCNLNYYGKDCTDFCEPSNRIQECIPNLHSVDRVCTANWTGIDCVNCIPQHYGPECNIKCVGTEFTECNEDGSLSCKAGFYNPPDCMVFCDATSEFYTCSSTGVKQCIGNRDVVTDCKICLPNYYGEDCDKYCYEPGLRFVCNTTTGNRECRKGFIGPECDACATDYYGTWCPKNEPCVLMCNQKCVNTVNYTCNIQGVLEMNADFSRTLYNKAEMFIPELIIAATTFTGALIIMGFCCIHSRLEKKLEDD